MALRRQLELLWQQNTQLHVENIQLSVERDLATADRDLAVVDRDLAVTGRYAVHHHLGIKRYGLATKFGPELWDERCGARRGCNNVLVFTS